MSHKQERKQLSVSAANREGDDLPELPVVYHSIVHRSYNELIPVIQPWADNVEQMLVKQHNADDETPRTHCHIMLVKPSIQRDRFNEILKLKIPGLEGRKDFFTLVKTIKRKGKNSVPYEVLPLARYILKGESSYNFGKNISPALLGEAVSTWVETDTPEDSGTSMERLIDIIEDELAQEFQTLSSCLRGEIQDDNYRNNVESLLKDKLQKCRDKAFYLLYKQKRIIPPGSLYKRVAGSAFIRLCEDNELFKEAIGIIQNLWY